jgi:hypothetical protein
MTTRQSGRTVAFVYADNPGGTNMTVRRMLAIVWTVGAFLVTLWGWAFYAGPFRWAAEWQLEHFGSYEVKLTIFGPLIVLLIPAGLLGGWGPLLDSPRPVNPAVRVANARRSARFIAILGVVALLIGGVGGALGYQKTRTPPSHADFVLASGVEPAPTTDLVTLTGVARTDLIVGYQETVAGSTSRWSYVPLVAPAWRAGEPIRFILKTNQTAWLPPAGTDGPRMPRMLQHNTPPFLMVTAPSVLKRHELPGVVRTEYERIKLPLDASVAVVQQSTGEVYAPYWMTAAGGGLVGVCLLMAGLIGSVNARRTAAA